MSRKGKGKREGTGDLDEDSCWLWPHGEGRGRRQMWDIFSNRTQWIFCYLGCRVWGKEMSKMILRPTEVDLRSPLWTKSSSQDFHFPSSLSKILRGTYIWRSKGRVAHSFTHLLLVLSCPSSLIEGPMEGAREMSNIVTNVSGLPWGPSGKESACQCRRYRFNPWVGKIPWNRKCNPLQYSCLENSMDRRVWWATVHGVTEIWTQFSN